MGKAGVIIPLCLMMASGCASFDGTDSVVDKKENPAATIESSALASVPVVTTTITPASVVEPRRVAPEDIRRWQMRLRGIGFDPGPIDGVAGAKTKAAFKRFESGCVQMSGLLDENAAGAQLNTNAGRPETVLLQSQLRDAGFDPGPIDGILGRRTKALLVQLRNGCPMAKEFSAFFDRTNGAAAIDTGVVEPSHRLMSERPALTAARLESTRKSTEPASPKPQEDIRILQLRLRDAGFDPGPFDGVMGPKTRLAMQQFHASQRAGKNKGVQMLGTNGQH